MGRLTNRLLVIALPLVGFIFLGRGIALFTSGDKANVGAVASRSAVPVPSLSPPTQSSGEPVLTHPKVRASMRRPSPIDTPSSQPPLAGPPSSHEQIVQRLDNLPTVERLDSLPEVEWSDTASRIYAMYQSMVGPTKPTRFRSPPVEDPTLFVEEDSRSENLAGKQTIGTPSVKGVAVKPRRRNEELARSTPLELINPHFRATPEGPPAQAARTSETSRRLPPRESSSPNPSIDRFLEVPDSPTLVSEPVVSEKPTERSHGIRDVVSNHEPVAADRPASEVLSDLRFVSRYDQMPSETNQATSETTGSPRAQDPVLGDSRFVSRYDQMPSETNQATSETTGSRRTQDAPQPRDASSAPEQDQTMSWGPMNLRTMELSDDVMQSKLAPQGATSQATSADKKRAQEALQLGIELAQRRSFYSSHARFIEALQIVAQSLDKLAFSNEHTFALRRGLRAYEEALDFQARSDPPDLEMNLNTLISRHDTSVLHHVNLDDWNREQCLREYMSFAEREIVSAVSPEPIAAQALYGLGRLQAHLHAGNSESAHVRTHRALMLYQASLIVDPRQYSAANELGVLLARHGQLKEAVTALRHCVRLSPQPTVWENLAAVHWQLGQADKARLASEEARMAKSMIPRPVVRAQ